MGCNRSSPALWLPSKLLELFLCKYLRNMQLPVFCSRDIYYPVLHVKGYREMVGYIWQKVPIHLRDDVSKLLESEAFHASQEVECCPILSLNIHISRGCESEKQIIVTKVSHIGKVECLHVGQLVLLQVRFRRIWLQPTCNLLVSQRWTERVLHNAADPKEGN